MFPLFHEERKPVDYLLSDEAIEAAAVTVNEVSQQGSVPELFVENKGDHRALFLEGEELHGAKQNRILNTTVLVPAHATLKIPVSCVEQGRWRRTSAFFASSKHMSPSGVRYRLKSSVSRSVKETASHSSDQGEVWAAVRAQQEALGVSSETAAQADTYGMYQKHIAEAQQAVKYVPGATGLAVALGRADCHRGSFRQAGDLRKGLEQTPVRSGARRPCAGPGSGRARARAGRPAPGKRAQARLGAEQSVGDGQEYRAEFNGNVASALLLDGTLVHGSVVAEWTQSA